MKVRTGFVSNSSSSSFIAVAKRIEAKDLNNAKNPYLYFEDGCEGPIFCDLTGNLIEFLMENKEAADAVTLYDVFKAKYEDGSFKFSEIKNCPEDADVLYGEIDHCQICTVDEFKEYILNEY